MAKTRPLAIVTDFPTPAPFTLTREDATMATAKATRNLKVLCPHCMNEEAEVKLNLNDLPTCECSECSETFTPDEAAAKFVQLAKRWQAVAAWVEQAPTL